MSYTGGPGDTCLDKRFSVVFYGFNDSVFSRSAMSYSLPISVLLDSWNKAFSRICVSFAACDTIVIPNYSHNRWEPFKTDQAVIKSWYKENTINVYFTDELSGAPLAMETGGYSYMDILPGMTKHMPFGAIEGTICAMVFQTGQTQTNLPVPAPPMLHIDGVHMMGHFFGLPDTFSESSATPASPTSTNGGVISTEFVDGSNSATHGDLFTDTEADCYPAGFDAGIIYHCACKWDVADGKSHMYYPPVDNFMSKWGNCSCRFTQQQLNFMAWYITKARIHLQ